MSKKNLDFILKNYPYPVKLRNKNEKDILICGVKHIESFYIQKRDFFDKIISNSCAIVSEYSPEFDSEDVDERVRRFFQYISHAALNHNKDIFYVDAWREDFEPIDVFLHAGGFATTAVGIACLVNHCHKKNKLSRRQFIKRLGLDIGLIGLGANLLTSSYLAEKMNGWVIYDDKFTVKDLFEYGANDYRNCRIAKGLETITKEFELPEKGYLLSIHGAMHTKPIAGYLDHNILRSIKLKTYYPTFGLGCCKHIKQFKSKNNKWVLHKQKKL